MSWLWRFLYAVFPPVELWRASFAIDREERVSEYKSNLEEYLNDYSGDLDQFFETVNDAHRAELDRNSHLDSKAGNYLGNVGVVLSILSLAPILAVVLGVDGQKAVFPDWPEALVLIPLGYAVTALLFSAYYSTKALQIRKYQVYYTAEGMKEQLKNNEEDREEMILNLLECKKSNEISNLEKTNATSVAQVLTRNGLFGLGLGLLLALLLSLPL